MRPSDPADAHLADRMFEVRVLKAGAVAFLVAFAAAFYSLLAVFGAFALVYLGYKLSYYADRVGAYGDDHEIKHARLELALLAVVGATAGALLAVEVLFPAEWTAGGFLSLPLVDFTAPLKLLNEPLAVLAWVVSVAPVIAVSYAGFQLRHRLLFGLDTGSAGVRAAVWESLARLPAYLLWIGVFTARPVFEIWRPAVALMADATGFTPRTTGGFATVLGDTFPAVVLGGVGIPAVVVGSYLGIQRWKYGDATVPEVLGPGVSPPSRHSHPLNVVSSLAVLLVYTTVVVLAVGTLPISDLGLAVAVVLAVLIGADVLARTTTTVRAVSERVAETVDAPIVGLVVGLVALLALTPVIGSGASFTTVMLTYPIVALPLVYLGNRVVSIHAVGDVDDFIDQLESDPATVDEAVADRLFVYSTAWDDTLRAAAAGGLVDLVRVSPYRRDDAVDVFVRAVGADDPAIVRAGLDGVATALSVDSTGRTYRRLINAGCREQVLAHLEGDDAGGETRVRATEAAARLFAADIEESGFDRVDDHLDGGETERMLNVVSQNPDNQALIGGVVEYLAAAWYAVGRQGPDEPVLTNEGAQRCLGALVRLVERADERARLTAVLAVTSTPASADDERFSLAVDRLDGDHEAVRFTATHVIRTSLDRHADALDEETLLVLLDDPSQAVRRAGAETIATFVQFAPEHAPALLDRLVLHLEETRSAPGLASAHVIRALESVDSERLADHPNAPSVLAAYIDEVPRRVAEAAADVLSSVVTAVPSVAREDAVGTAIEAGLVHESSEVRLDCLEAVVAVVDDDVDAGRRYVRGLAANLGADGTRGGLAAVCLAELLEAHPEAGLDVVPALADGLGNLRPVHRQAVPFTVRGGTVSAVTVDLLGSVVAADPSAGAPLIDPLTDVATTAEGATLERILKLLSALSAEFPTECRGVVGTAAAVIEDGRVGVRRAAAEVLANVAAHHPDAVEPFVDRLVLATDDGSGRVRAAALVALGNVSVASPAALEGDVHRVVGLLDDDSATVRARAANLIVTIAEREPTVVEPAAETADRLRRLQRDPAVDYDPERLQDASTAIQTGIAVEDDAGTESDSEEIWTPETAEEMGASGDTEVFEPIPDEFDDIDDEFETPTPDDEGDEDGEPASEPADVENLETAVGSDQAADETDDAAAGVEDIETAIGPSTDAKTPDEPDDDVEGLDTVIDPDRDAVDDAAGDPDAVDDLETAIEPSGDRDSTDAPGEPDERSGDVDDLETAIESGDDGRNAGGETDVDDLETAIEPSDDRGGQNTADVEEFETRIDRGEEPSEENAEDVEDLETTLEPDGEEDDERADDA